MVKLKPEFYASFGNMLENNISTIRRLLRAEDVKEHCHDMVMSAYVIKHHIIIMESVKNHSYVNEMNTSCTQHCDNYKI